MDYKSDYNYFDPSRSHKEQIQYEKEKLVFPYMYVDSENLADDKKPYSVCVPSKFGKENSEFGKLNHMKKQEIKDLAQRKSNPFLNVVYVKANNSIRLCNIDMNGRYSSQIMDIYKAFFEHLRVDGFNIKGIQYLKEDYTLKSVNELKNFEYNYFLKISCTFKYDKYEVFFVIRQALEGVLTISCTVDEDIAGNLKRGTRYNIFKNEPTSEIVDISDSCRSHNIAKKMMIEWMYELKSWILRNSGKKESVKGNKEDLNDANCKFDEDDEGAFKWSDYQTLRRNNRKLYELAGRVDAFLLDNLYYKQIKNIMWKVDPYNAGSHNEIDGVKVYHPNEIHVDVSISSLMRLGNNHYNKANTIYVGYNFDTKLYYVEYKELSSMRKENKDLQVVLGDFLRYINFLVQNYK